MPNYKKSTFTYNPTGMDIYRPVSKNLKQGMQVQVAAPIEFGVRGKLGRQFAYVKDAATGEKYGMVNRASLSLNKRKK